MGLRPSKVQFSKSWRKARGYGMASAQEPCNAKETDRRRAGAMSPRKTGEIGCLGQDRILGQVQWAPMPLSRLGQRPRVAGDEALLPRSRAPVLHHINLGIERCLQRRLQLQLRSWGRSHRKLWLRRRDDVGATWGSVPLRNLRAHDVPCVCHWPVARHCGPATIPNSI